MMASNQEYEESDMEASSEEESTDSDSTVMYDESDSDLDITDSSYHIATEPVDQAPDLSNVNDIPWIHIVQPENGHVDFHFDVPASSTKHINNCERPLDFFYLMYSPYLWNLMVANTNKYANDVPLNGWKNINVKTMKGFIAVIFNMGLIKKNLVNDYWSTRFSMSTPWFNMMFTRDRFKQILCAFHIVDNSSIPPKDDPTYRPSARVRPLLDYIDSVCTHYFTPGRTIAIDESLVAGKVRNPIRQYLPNKHHARFGTKVWMLADSTNAYILKCYIYEGAKFDPTSGIAGTGYDVGVRLMEMGKCFDKGHHLFTDNLFTTYAAASYLLERNTFLTGTMRRNQLKHLPNEIVSAKPKINEKVYYRKEKFLAMSYRQKQSQTKPLIMLSTFSGAFDVPH